MKVLGIFGGYYNPAACLIIDGKMIAFIEEEKLTRKKTEKNTYPIRAIKFCLKQAGITMKDVDRIAFPWSATKNITALPWIGVKETLKGMFGTTHGKFPVNIPSPVPNGLSNLMTFLSSTPWENRRKIVSEIRYGGILDKIPPITFIPHHQSHAASCFYASGFDKSLILIVDGMGDDLSTSIWIGEGKSLRKYKEVKFPNSLGEFYSAFTEFIGFIPYSGEGKLMGLAAFGHKDDAIIDDLRREVIKIGNGTYDVNTLYTITGAHNFGERYTDALVALFGNPRQRESEFTDFHYNLAFGAQYLLEEAILSVLRKAMEETGLKNICIGGGVAMNCKMNGKVQHEPGVEAVFINPAANDSGSAMGAAMVVAMENGDDCRFKMEHAYWGPGFNNKQVEAMLKEARVTYRKCDDIAKDTAELMVQEKIIGWHQGRMEVGARALGARSILASPLTRGMLDKVNNNVKHREPWRPFAPAMLAEEAKNYYSLGAESPFMILAFEVLKEKRDKIPAVTHVDNSCRPQTIKREHNAKYYDLIRNFGKKTGVPVILNTSFNVRGEPIVCSPEDSLRCFFATGMDALAIEDFLVLKENH